MSAGAQEQVSRLLLMLPYLLAHPGVRVSEVAQLYGVSELQVVRDLNVLWFSGLPGLAMGDYIEVDMEAVEGEGVINVSNADYLARPLRLGTDEALALLVAVRTLAAIPAAGDRDAVDRVVAKLERAAGAAAERALAVRVELDAGARGEVAGSVRRALTDRRLLHLSYWVPGRDERTERDVDPMRLVVVEGRPYLEAWCRRARGVRLFRLDRVEAAYVLDVPAEVPPHARPRDLAAGLFQPSPDDDLVTLDLDPGARWVGDHYPCESVEDRDDGSRRIRLRTPDPRWVRRLVLRLGGAARIADPPELAEAVRRDAREALTAYDVHLGSGTAAAG
ncbi:MAG TPA: WYL domain-containing protein [Jiangellales bacterium]|nr:WYL domain-containing protein [Jiangellales bacterium]